MFSRVGFVYFLVVVVVVVVRSGDDSWLYAYKHDQMALATVTWPVSRHTLLPHHSISAGDDEERR